MAKTTRYTKDGKSYWRIKGYLGTDPISGKQKNYNQGEFLSSRDAENAFYEAKQEYNKTKHTTLKGTTFEEIYDLWMETVYQHQVRPSTLIATQGKFRNHILPVIGSKKIDQITVDDIQSFANYIYYEIKYCTPRSLINFISNVFDFSIKRNLVERNPVLMIEKMRRVRNMDHDDRIDYLTSEEIEAVLNNLKENDQFYKYVYYYLIFVTGVRNGEIIALKWSNVDLENKMIYIKHSRTIGLDHKGTIGTTKNGKSRTIPISEKAIKLLKEWKQMQSIELSSEKAIKQGLKLEKDENQLVFPNQKNKVLNPVTTYNWLKKVEKRTGIKDLHPHKIRHTFTTLSIPLSSSVKEVSDILGHSDVAFTLNVYASSIEKEKIKVVNGLDNILDHKAQ